MRSSGITDQTLFFEAALLPQGWESSVRVTLRDGIIADVNIGAGTDGAERHWAAVPGMPNLHSHAFQRGMAGWAETSRTRRDSFWTWREVMYRFVDRIDPKALHAIAALAYAEMLESGFTRVGEFHYLHHDRDGTPFGDAAEMSRAIIAAAEDTGIALTLLPVFYAHSGFGGTPPGGQQRRFVHSLDSFAVLLEALRGAAATLPDMVVGIAPHSLRAVTPMQLAALEAMAPQGPVHIHIAEQMREVKDCLDWSGRRPVELLMDHAAVDGRWCLVHATHLTEAEVSSIARSEAVAGLCPITEANLGDGLFPAPSFIAQGGRYGIGSDSNVLIDAAEEMRLLEYVQRLAGQQRNVLGTPGGSTGDSIYRAAVSGGGQALGSEAGIAAGVPADIVSLDRNHPSMIGRRAKEITDGFIFAGRTPVVDCVWRRGRKVVTAGRHMDRDRIVAEYRREVAALLD